MPKKVMLIASIVFWFFVAAFHFIDTPNSPSTINIVGKQYSHLIMMFAVLLPIIVFPLTLLFVASVKKLRGKDLAMSGAKRTIITILTALLGLFLLIPPGIMYAIPSLYVILAYQFWRRQDRPISRAMYIGIGCYLWLIGNMASSLISNPADIVDRYPFVIVLSWVFFLGCGIAPLWQVLFNKELSA